jgi:hypothetical protein
MRYILATSLVDRTIQPAAGSSGGAEWTDMPCELVRGTNRLPGNGFTVGDFGILWLNAKGRGAGRC